MTNDRQKLLEMGDDLLLPKVPAPAEVDTSPAVDRIQRALLTPSSEDPAKTIRRAVAPIALFLHLRWVEGAESAGKSAVPIGDGLVLAHAGLWRRLVSPDLPASWFDWIQ